MAEEKKPKRGFLDRVRNMMFSSEDEVKIDEDVQRLLEEQEQSQQREDARLFRESKDNTVGGIPPLEQFEIEEISRATLNQLISVFHKYTEAGLIRREDANELIKITDARRGEIIQVINAQHTTDRSKQLEIDIITDFLGKKKKILIKNLLVVNALPLQFSTIDRVKERKKAVANAISVDVLADIVDGFMTGK